MIMETVRGFYEGYYREVVAPDLPIQKGRALLDRFGHGLGVQLREEFLGRRNLIRRVSHSTHADLSATRLSALPNFPAASVLPLVATGGSGFIFKTSAGRQIWIDPYLSDAARAIFGVGRAFPAPIAACEAEPDIVISTHWHEDHLDPGSIPEIARRRPAVRFIMPPSAMARALSWGLPRTQITPLIHGETLDLGGSREITWPSLRSPAGRGGGWEVPDAVGVLLDFAGVRVFHSGDTEYDARIHRAIAATPLALATLCINGSGGNMNAYEAALLAWHLDVHSLVPHHHYIWAKDKPEQGETLDPRCFAETYRRLAGHAEACSTIPTVGGEALRQRPGAGFNPSNEHRQHRRVSYGRLRRYWARIIGGFSPPVDQALAAAMTFLGRLDTVIGNAVMVVSGNRFSQRHCRRAWASTLALNPDGNFPSTTTVKLARAKGPVEGLTRHYHSRAEMPCTARGNCASNAEPAVVVIAQVLAPQSQGKST